MTIVCTAQTDLAGHGVEGPMNLGTIEPIAPTGNEQVRGHGPPCPMALASGDVIFKHLAGRSMQRHPSVLPELGAANREYSGLQIDILKLEIARFPEP